MRRRILRIQPVILFELEQNETQDQAEDRFLNILYDEGFNVVTYTSILVDARIERRNEDEVRSGD